MKYQCIDIGSMWDNQLISAYQNCQHQRKEREKASSHEKFNKDRMINNRIVKKMDFPPINPAFAELEQNLLNEINKRKLKV